MLLQLPYCYVTNGCKSAPAQYKHGYYLAPLQSPSRKPIKTKPMLCKPLFITHARVKSLLSYAAVQKWNASFASVDMTHALRNL